MDTETSLCFEETSNLSFEETSNLCFDILLDIADINYTIWNIVATSIPNIGIYSLRKKLQKRLKDKWKSFYHTENVTMVVNRGYRLPNGHNHGIFNLRFWEGHDYAGSTFVTCKYKDGENVGMWNRWGHFDFLLQKGRYKNGKKHGWWLDGNTCYKEHIKYDNGEEIETITFDENSIVITKYFNQKELFSDSDD